MASFVLYCIYDNKLGGVKKKTKICLCNIGMVPYFNSACIIISSKVFYIEPFFKQVSFCQKHLTLHQLTHNMTTDCSLNYDFSTWKFQAQNILCTQIVFFCFDIQNNLCTKHALSLEISCKYWTPNSMNNLLSYYGLIDARISASERDLPVKSK